MFSFAVNFWRFGVASWNIKGPLIFLTLTPTGTSHSLPLWQGQELYRELPGCMGTFRYFGNCEPIQPILDGDLEICLWSQVSLK